MELLRFGDESGAVEPLAELAEEQVEGEDGLREGAHDVDDEDGTQAIGLIVDLMVQAVVEEHTLSLLPCVVFGAHANGGRVAEGDAQAEVVANVRLGGAGVRGAEAPG